MNIGITGPDIIISKGGAQNVAVNVIKILNNHYNIIYLPDPELYNKFRSNKNNTIKIANNLERAGIKITKYFYDILDNNYNYDEIINIYSKENMDFIFNFDFIGNFIFSKNFTLELSKKMNLKYGVCLQGLGNYDIHLFKYMYSTLMLSKNFHIFLYRVYNFIYRHFLLFELANSDNLLFILVIYENYNDNININFENIEIINPAIGVINSNIDISMYINMHKENKIIFFARLNYLKGILDIPKILKLIIKKYNTKIVICGKFNRDFERKLFFKMVNKLKLNDYVVYKGYLSDDELYNEISTSKLMLYPSHDDSQPIAVMQSLSLYTPVVAYNIAGLKIYNDFKSVKLVKEFDYKSMANEALKMLKMENTYNLFNDNINEFIKKHNWYNVAMEYKNIIEKYSKNDARIEKNAKDIDVYN